MIVAEKSLTTLGGLVSRDICYLFNLWAMIGKVVSVGYAGYQYLLIMNNINCSVMYTAAVCKIAIFQRCQGT